MNNELLIHEMDCTNHCVGSKGKVVDSTQGFKKSNNGTNNALMIKCRVTGNKDDDFIEVDVAQLRKLPNVIVSCVLFVSNRTIQITSYHFSRAKRDSILINL